MGERAGWDEGRSSSLVPPSATVPLPRPPKDCDRHFACMICRDLLAGRVPITLIMDLAMPSGPHSAELLEAEGLPTQYWWERLPEV